MDDDVRRSRLTTVKVMAALSSGWAVSLVLGLVSAKLTAVLLGPAGVGYIGLLQSTMGLAALAAMMGGVSAGVIPAITRARASGDPHQEAAARTAVWFLWALFGGVSAALLLAFQEPLASLLLGTSERAAAIPPLTVAVILTLAAGIQTSTLAAHRRIADLARVGVANSVIGPAFLLPLIWIWRESAVAWAICAGSVASVLVSTYFVQRGTRGPGVRVSRQQVLGAARSLLWFGIPYNTSALAGTGVQLAIPVLVLHALGSTDVGLYRAAAGVSTVHLGFLASAMGQDYYPRVSAAGDDPAILSRVVNDQARVVLLLTGPVILGLLAFAPYIVPLVYTPQFAPVVPMIEWQLIGDILKVSGWALGFAVLGRRGALTYLWAELICGTTLLVSSWVGMRLFQLEGVGIASLVSGGVSFFLYLAVARRTIGVWWTRQNWMLLVALLGGALMIRAVACAGIDALRIAVGFAVTMTAAAGSIRTLRSEAGGLRALIPRRRAS